MSLFARTFSIGLIIASLLITGCLKPESLPAQRRRTTSPTHDPSQNEKPASAPSATDKSTPPMDNPVTKPAEPAKQDRRKQSPPGTRPNRVAKAEPAKTEPAKAAGDDENDDRLPRLKNSRQDHQDEAGHVIAVAFEEPQRSHNLNFSPAQAPEKNSRHRSGHQ